MISKDADESRFFIVEITFRLKVALYAQASQSNSPLLCAKSLYAAPHRRLPQRLIGLLLL
jgi:hypothetical protein